LMNICFLSASENNRVSDGDPATYIPELVTKLGAQSGAVLASNLLPLPAEFDYARSKYDEFLEARALVAEGWVARLCEGEC